MCLFVIHPCHKPSPRLATKARACKGAGQQWSPWITFHTPGNVGECEGMNPHTPKWTLALGVGVSMDPWIFRGKLQGFKFIGLNNFIYYWKSLGTYMYKMGLHDPFGYLKYKLWSKEGRAMESCHYINIAKHIGWKRIMVTPFGVSHCTTF
jgi:hypothetical protein